MKRSQQIDIKRTLALSGAFSFLCSCSQACLLPFLTLYLRQLGLTPAMAGVVVGARRLLGLAWSPAAGLLAARYRKRRAVIVCSLLLSAAVALLLLLLPPVDAAAGGRPCGARGPEAAPSRGPTPTGAGSDPSTAWTHPTAPPATATDPTDMGSAPTDMGSVPADVGSVPAATGGSPPPAVDETVAVTMTSSSAASPSAAPVRNVRSGNQPGEPEGEGGAGLGFLGSLKEMDTHTQLFLTVLVIASVWECFSAPLERAADDGLFEYLDQADASDRHASAGPRGPWGLLGAACGAGGAGLLAGRLGCPLAAGVHFYGYAGLAVLALPLAACLPLHAGGKAGRSGGALKALRLVAGCPRARLGAITAVAAGAANAAAEDFLLWQMQDHGSGQLHMGLALALAALSQAAYPLLSGRLARLLGPGRVLVAGAAGLALQSFYYSFLWGPWAALPAQALTCLGAGAVWWALGVQSEDVAAPGAERSVRRLYGALSQGLGGGLGSLGGGLVAQRFGLAWLFRGVGVALMAWCACLPLLQWRAPLQRRVNYSRLLAADGSEASDSGSEQERDWLDRAMDEDCRQHADGKTLTSGF